MISSAMNEPEGDDDASIVVQERTVPIEWPSGVSSLLNTSAASEDTLTERRSSIHLPNNACASMPDLSSVGPGRSRSRNSSGQMTPVRPMTLREYEQQLSDLKKENFNLKLRIYFLESKLPKLDGLQGTDLCKQVIELQCRIETVQKDSEYTCDQLEKAQSTLERQQRTNKRNEEQFREEKMDLQNRYERKLEDTQTRLAVVIKEYNTATRRLSDLAFENEQLKTNGAASDENVCSQGSDSLACLLNEREKEIVDLKQEIASLQSSAERERAEFEQRIGQLHTDLLEAQQQVPEFRVPSPRTPKAVTFSQSTMAPGDLTSQLERYQLIPADQGSEHRSQLESQLQEAEHEKSALQVQLQDRSLNQTSIADLTTNLEALAVENENLRQMLASLDTSPNHNQEAAKLHDFIVQSSNVNQILRQRFQRLLGDNDLSLAAFDQSNSILQTPARPSQRYRLSMSARSVVQFEPRVSEAKEALDAALARAQQLEEEENRSRMQIEQLSQQLEKEKTRAEKLDAALKASTTMLKTLDEASEKQKSKRFELEQTLADASRRPDTVCVCISTQETMGDLQALEAENRRLQELASFKPQTESAEVQTEELEALLGLQEQLQDSKAKLQSTEDRMYAALNDLESVQNERDNLQQSMAGITAQNRSLEACQAELELKLQETEKQLQTAVEQVQQLEQEKAKLASSQAELSDCERKLLATQDRLSTACKDLQTIQAEKQELQNSSKALSSQNQQLLFAQKELSDQCSLLQAELQKTKKPRMKERGMNTQTTMQEMENLIGETLRMQEAVNIMQSEVVNRDRRIGHLEGKIEDTVKGRSNVRDAGCGTEETMQDLHRLESRCSKLEQYGRNVKSKLRTYQASARAQQPTSPRPLDTSASLAQLESVLEAQNTRAIDMDAIVKQLEANNAELELRLRSGALSDQERRAFEEKCKSKETECRENMSQDISPVKEPEIIDLSDSFSSVDLTLKDMLRKAVKYRTKVKEQKEEILKLMDENMQLQQTIKLQQRTHSRPHSASSSEVEQKGSLPEADMPTPTDPKGSSSSRTDRSRSRKLEIGHQLQQTLCHARKLTDLVRDFERIKTLSPDEQRQMQTYISELRFGLDFVAQLTASQSDQAAGGDAPLAEIEQLRAENRELRSKVADTHKMISKTENRLSIASAGDDGKSIARELAKIRVVLQQKNRQDASRDKEN